MHSRGFPTSSTLSASSQSNISSETNLIIKYVLVNLICIVSLYLVPPQCVVVEGDGGHGVWLSLDDLVVECEWVDVGEAPVVLALQRLQRRQVVECLPKIDERIASLRSKFEIFAKVNLKWCDL